MHENIEQKFEKLEKELKKVKGINSVLIILTFSFILFGFQQKIKLPDIELPSVIEAEKFILKNENGTSAELKIVDDKNAALIFYKENGNKVALNLGLNDNKSFINIPGEKSNKFLVTENNSNAFLYIANDLKNKESFIQIDPNNDSPFISIKNSVGNNTYINNNGTKVIKDSLFMMYGKDFAFETVNNSNKIVDLPGSYGVNVYKATNNNREFYYSSGFEPVNKNSYVEVYNPKSNSSTSLKVINNLPGLVGIKDNKLRYLMFIDENDKASLKIHDNNGLARSIIGSESINVNGQQQSTDESTIMLFNDKGNLLEKFPK